uniref:Vesicle transport protein n=1 Tax=Haemonchus contortus TaxID=6289 RepID=A0A7I4YCM2_HAECO
MSMMDLQIEKQYSFCGLSLRCATQACTAIQALLCLVLGISYRVLLEPSVIASILFGIHMFCTILSLMFLVFCFLKRKFGTFYEVLLHAYLLSILLMALTSLFAVMFLPLAFLQQSHSFSEGMHYLFLLATAAAMLTLQFVQRNLVEQMLPLMESCFV